MAFIKPVTFLVIGAGDRGLAYSYYSKLHPLEMKITAVAEPDSKRRQKFKKIFQLNEENCFDNFQQAVKKKIADAVIIATPDKLHFQPAMKSIETGYDILLEKPAAISKKQCISLINQNAKFKRIIGVCHVLRYTPFWTGLKRLIDSGALGKVITIEHLEGVGWWHHAHSYVRGNWSDTKKSSPMILTKSCHDMDLLLWLTGKKCKKIASFGSLIHFKTANAPKGSTLRCTDNCKVEYECPYSAKKIYLNMKHKGWPVNTITNDMSYKGRLKAITEGPYGRCVYHCGNNAVDHQVVSIEFEEGITASFTMSAFTNLGRSIRVMGTMGEAEGDGEKIIFRNFRNGRERLIITESKGQDINSGHGGGDYGLMNAFLKAVQFQNKKYLLSTFEESIESHLIAFAAEESRLTQHIIELN